MLIIAGMGELLNSNPDSALVFFISGLFKIHDVQIVFDVVNVLASWDYYESHLDVPA